MSNQWKLVPVEPTESMVINGFESAPDECFSDEEVWEQYQCMSGCQQAAFRAKLCWAAMLAASPVPPVDLDRVVAERNGLQMSLNTADQSIDGLNAAISRRTRRVRELEAQLSCAVDALNEVVKASAMYEKPFEIATLAIGEMSAITQADGVAATEPCYWKFGAFSWQTGCGTEWMLNDGTPEQNGMHFCHSCGKTLVVEEPEDA